MITPEQPLATSGRSWLHSGRPGNRSQESRRNRVMQITDVRAHHIRIPYDAGVASFRQGAASIAALEMALVEVSTDSGLTGWGDAFSYVCPKTTCSAISEMIAPQARGLEAPDAAGIPGFMENIQRNLHLFGRYGI